MIKLKEDAVSKLIGVENWTEGMDIPAEQRRPALEPYKGVKKETLAAKLREMGITVGEYAEQLGYEDAGAFLKAELNVDIKTLVLEELWTSEELVGMTPELFLDTILMANLNAMVTHNFVTEIPIDRGDITIRTFEDSGMIYEVAPGGEIPDDQGVMTRRTHHVKKIGRGLGWTYEDQQRAAFPLIQINLQRLGMRMALKEDYDVLLTLRTGIAAQSATQGQPAQPAVMTPVTVSQSNVGGSGIAAGTMTFVDLVNIKTDVANRNYNADFAVMSPITYSKFLMIPQVTNFLNGGPAASTVLDTGIISHFLGMDIYITKQMPDNEVLAGQRGFAGVKFVETPLTLEEEKIIQKQTQRCQVTKRYIPAVLYPAALTRMPF